MVRQQRSTPRTHQFVDNLVVLTCHSLPDLMKPHIIASVNEMLRNVEIIWNRTCCIKQTEGVWFTSNHDSDCIIVKYLWNIQLKAVELHPNNNTMIQLTVGTYSDGNLLVVYEMRRQVLPTAPSPTTTHLMVCMLFLQTLKFNRRRYITKLW